MPTRRIAVRGIVIEDGKLFAVKHKEKDGTESDFWAIPGGGLDPSESLHDGLHREMIEEMGVTPKVGKLLFVQQYRIKEYEFMEFFFHIENASEYRNVDLSATTHGHLELSRCEFIDPKREYILPEFLQTIDIETQISSGQAVHIANYL